MTRNILIATIFSLATAILLGIIFVGESHRLPEATAAISAEQLERGARDYEQYCASCHGLAGQGGVRFGAPALNDIVQRYTQGQNGQPAPFDQPNGVKEKYGSMRNYIEAILFSGIRGTPMPAWGQPQGPLRRDQIQNITGYVLSWNGNVPESAKQSANRIATEQAPTPDPKANPVSQGEIVFQQKGCVGCHAMSDQKMVGPGLGGLFEPEGTAAYGNQLPNGKPVNDETVKEWILSGTAPFQAQHIEPKDGQQYPPMPAVAVTDEEYAKLLVWLKAHKRDGTLTEEAQQIIEQGQQGQGSGAVEPTVQPTGRPNQPGAPNSPVGPGSTATP
jgi:cytochrome c oxidase cbb3-type subunit 3